MGFSKANREKRHFISKVVFADITLSSRNVKVDLRNS